MLARTLATAATSPPSFSDKCEQQPRLQAMTSAAEQKQYSKWPELLRNTGYLSLNIVSSVALVMGNKHLFAETDFKFNTLLTVLHFVATSAFLEVAKLSGLVQRKSVAVWRVLPLSATFCCFVVTTNLSLLLNSTSTFQLVKILNGPTVALLQFLLYGRRLPRLVLLSMAVMCVGVTLATTNDVQMNAKGLLVAATGCLAAAVYQMYAEVEQRRLGLDALQLLSYQAPISAVMLACFVPVLENVEMLRVYRPSLPVMLTLSGTALLAILVNVSTMLIIGKMSAVTYSVNGNAKLCLVLLCGHFFFDKVVVPLNLLGAVIALSGVFWYSYLKLRVVE